MRTREIKRQLTLIAQSPKNWEIFEGEGARYEAYYLGSYVSLDPCGKYHHFLSPNGVTSKCEIFWDNLDRAAASLNMWIEAGKGDPTDIYLCRDI